MKFDLKCTLVFSKSLDEARETLKNFIQETNISTPDKFHIQSWSIDDNKLVLHIQSQDSIRAHEYLLRLKKTLDTVLGKKHKMGIRKIKLNDYFIIFNLDTVPSKKIHIPLAQVDIKDKTVTLHVQDKDEEFLTRNYIDRMINLVKEKAQFQKYGGKKEDWKLLWQSSQKKPVWSKDPTEVMSHLGWIEQGPTKGKWFFRPPAAAIMRTMAQIAVEKVLQPLQFHEVIPSLHVPLATWLKTGHLEGMPGEIYYISEPVTRDIKKWETFIDLIKIKKEIPFEEFSQLVGAPKAGICYAQCPNIYWSFLGKTIAESALPLLLYDCSVPSARYESGGRHGIERVDEFHRIEVVYIGTQDQLLDLKEKLIDRYKVIFNDILDLEWRMAQVTPFYLQQAGKIIEDEPNAGTIDFEAWLPYRGDRKTPWLEFQNVSIVGEKYVRAFNIKTQKSILWSGCSGIGLERWTTAFLAQKGIDPKNWPKSFKKFLPQLPSPPKFL
jgi:seryl-tRNA synthetase